MSESTLVRDLAVVMVTSGIVTTLFHRLRQPVVLGYILAGVIIGPHTPPFAFVQDAHSIETLAELGVTLLLFGIGLEFSLQKLGRVGGVALAGAAFEIPVMVWLGFSAGRLAGWGTTESVFLGAILSISSTTIIAKALAELRQTGDEYARIVMGILIVEDLVAIVMLVLLSSLARAGEVAVGQALFVLGAVTLFVVTTTVIGLLLVPRLLATVERIGMHEVLTVTTLGCCFGSAILARELGFSPALGAFLAGAVMAETRQVRQIEERIESIRDMFSAIFFVAVGMQIDPWVIFENASFVLFLAMLTVVGKVFACSAATVACGYSPRTALRVGMALGQIGEFSFVIALLGKQAGAVPDTLYPLTVAVSAVTTLSTPYQIRGTDWLATRLAPLAPAPLRALITFYQGKIRKSRAHPSAFSPEIRGALVRGFVSTTLVVAPVVHGPRATPRRRARLAVARAPSRRGGIDVVRLWSCLPAGARRCLECRRPARERASRHPHRRRLEQGSRRDHTIRLSGRERRAIPGSGLADPAGGGAAGGSGLGGFAGRIALLAVAPRRPLQGRGPIGKRVFRARLERGDACPAGSAHRGALGEVSLRGSRRGFRRAVS